MKRAFFAAALALCASVLFPQVARAQATSAIPYRSLVTSVSGAGGAATMLNLTGQSSCTSTISGAFNETLAFRTSNDGTHWTPVTSYPDPGSGNNSTQTTTIAGSWTSPLGSAADFQVYVTSYTSGIATVQITCGAGTSPTSSSTVVTNFPATQTVVVSGTATVVQPSGANLHMNCDSGCGSSPPFLYNIDTGTSAVVIKTGSGTFGGFHNLSTSAQTSGMTCTWYDNTSANPPIISQVFQLGASQYITIGGGNGMKFNTGLTVQCTGGTPTAPGIATLYL